MIPIFFPQVVSSPSQANLNIWVASQPTSQHKVPEGILHHRCPIFWGLISRPAISSGVALSALFLSPWKEVEGAIHPHWMKFALIYLKALPPLHLSTCCTSRVYLLMAYPWWNSEETHRIETLFGPDPLLGPHDSIPGDPWDDDALDIYLPFIYFFNIKDSNVAKQKKYYISALDSMGECLLRYSGSLFFSWKPWDLAQLKHPRFIKTQWSGPLPRSRYFCEFPRRGSVVSVGFLNVHFVQV